MHIQEWGSYMKCPKCGRTLEQGFLVGFHLHRAVYWMPEGAKGAPHGLANDQERLKIKGGHLVLSIGNAFAEPRLKTWYCPDCRCGVFESE